MGEENTTVQLFAKGRSVPRAEFVELDRTMTNEALAAHYNVSVDVIWKVRKRLNVPSKRIKPPNKVEFVEAYKYLTTAEMKVKFNRSQGIILHWAKRYGCSKPVGRPRLSRVEEEH